MYGTWDVSFTAIKLKEMHTAVAGSAVFVLETFAFFHHDNIAEGILKQAAEALKKATLDRSTNVGLSHQLVQFDQEDNWDPYGF